MTHVIIRLSPAWPRRLHARLERWIDGLWSLSTGPAGEAARRAGTMLARLPSWCWPLVVACAAWPSVAWAARRLVDDSDDPLGIVAIVALLMATWHARRRFGRSPRAGWLAVAVASVVVSNLPAPAWPDLVRGLLASAAVVAALAAIADPDEPIAPYAGLAVLALPLLSSLQFYAGFPLRVVTAEATRWLLAASGATVARVGTALTVDGRLVIVDAPCSGVQMAWVGYFCACATAWIFRVSNRAFIARLPVVGATVMTGNVLRNTVLVAADAHRVAMTDAMHAAVGLLAFAGVAAIIVATFARAPRAMADDRIERRHAVGVASSASSASSSASSASSSASSAPALACLAALACAALLPFAARDEPPHRIEGPREWPTTRDGLSLRPLALSPVELRFATQFPGTIARFESGRETVVLRDVDRPTRRLHPAVDCYRGSGFAIGGERLERGADAQLRRCFTATRDGRALRVCEWVVGADGDAYTDVSAWFWAASLGRSRGPWRAETTATPVDGASS